jgi:hypothetical protein
MSLASIVGEVPEQLLVFITEVVQVLRGQLCPPDSYVSVKDVIQHWLKGWTTTFFSGGIQKMFSLYDKCLN